MSNMLTRRKVIRRALKANAIWLGCYAAQKHCPLGTPYPTRAGYIWRSVVSHRYAAIYNLPDIFTPWKRRLMALRFADNLARVRRDGGFVMVAGRFYATPFIYQRLGEWPTEFYSRLNYARHRVLCLLKGTAPLW